MKYSEIPPDKRRRYYLHRRLSPSVRKIVSIKKSVSLSDDMLTTLSKAQMRNLNELITRFGYSIHTKFHTPINTTKTLKQ